MIRKITPADKELYLKLANEFYHSEAVLHPVPQKNIDATFCELMRSDVYTEGFIIERDGDTAGYALIAKKLFAGGRRHGHLGRGAFYETTVQREGSRQRVF